MATEPTNQATNVLYTDVLDTTATISWTNGNGEKRAVFIRNGSTGSATPSDETTYTGNAAYGSGTQIGPTGWFCIYNGTGTTVDVTSLVPETTFRTHVCEYNGSAGSENYLVDTATGNPANQTTNESRPTTQATNVLYTDVEETTLTLDWTNGNGAKRAVFVKEGSTGTSAPVDDTTYTANLAFGSGTQIGSTGWYCVYNGTGTTADITGLTASTTYRTHVCEYDGSAGSENYLVDAGTGNPANQETDTPPTGALKTKVQIDGTTIWDDSDSEAPTLLINWEYEKTGTNQISEMVINLIKTAQDTVSLTVGKSVSVWMGYSTSTETKIFEGNIAESSPDGGVVKLICKDKLWNLIRRKVNNIYESSGTQAGQISAIAEDIIETYGGLTADVVATGTAATDIIAEFRCDYASCFERLVTLAAAVRYQFWYDPITDVVKFEPEGYNDTGDTLTVGEEIIGIPKWSNDTSRLINDLRTDGAVSNSQTRLPIGSGNGIIGTTTGFDTDGIQLDKTPESVELIFENANPPTVVKVGGTKDSTSGHFYYVDKENKKILPAEGTTFTSGHRAIVNYTWLAPAPIHEINQESIDAYGLSAERVSLTDIQTVADATVRTVEILSKFSEPFLVGEMLVKTVSTIDVNLGDKVTIVDTISNPNINQKLVVTKQVIKYPGSNQEITVGDEAVRLADWQMNTSNRLKLLEDQISLKNQDLLLEIVDIRNNMFLVPRYTKILKRLVTPDYFWGADNWGAGEWDDSYDNENEEVFVAQYNNSYEENFLDTDFKNTTNTDATWGTTGSVSFTSGQVAESTPVDLDNGIVGSVILTATEVSGDFDYEVTCNAGVPPILWESITPGVAHVFSSSQTTYEECDETPNTQGAITDPTYRQAQAFTIGAAGRNTDFTLASINILAYRTGSPGTITINLYKSDGDGYPIGSPISTGTASTNGWTTNSSGSTASFTMSGVTLEASTQYTFVISGASIDVSNYITLKGVFGGLYSGGDSFFSVNSGSSWQSSSTVDFIFSVTGAGAAEGLAWRATENAGSTGEISQIKLTNYH